MKRYTNGEVTILWRAELCTHSGNCVRGLPGVFDPARRPWIDPQSAPTEALIDQVRMCPSGALDFEVNGPSEE
jgi:uncharacterized Fe-S cluster protein YjdI